MLKRVRAAWRVLRGEWTANAPAPLVYQPTTTTSAAAHSTRSR
jgi:hypothetical protein